MRHQMPLNSSLMVHSAASLRLHGVVTRREYWCRCASGQAAAGGSSMEQQQVVAQQPPSLPGDINSRRVSIGARPAFGGSFVKLREPDTRVAPCRLCGGSGHVCCSSCGGSGRLGRGGYHRNNPVNLNRLVGSKWTAMQRTLGWRHFRCTQKRKTGGQTYALLVATCDEGTQVRPCEPCQSQT